MTLCPVCGSSVPASASTCPACGAPLNAGGLSQTLPPGTRLAGGKYELDKVLGQGGFGITYTGTQTQLGQRVAIKELFPSGSVRQNGTFVLPPAGTDPAGWARIKQDFTVEGRTVARFNHPDIVRVMDLFDENGTAYLVMELLQGRSLGSEIEQRGSLPPGEVITIAQRVLSALKVVHDAGMLHRDIKPDNIYLDKGGRIVLIDFGSAREYAAGQDSSHTRLVTPGYAPLEQYTSSARFGPYTDLYAFGATLYHALTGHPPAAATDRSMGTPLAPLPANTPPALQQLIERCLETNIAKRPQSVDEALALLSQASVAAAPRPAPQPQPMPQPAPPMPQRPPQPQPQPVPQPIPQRPQPAPQRQRAPGCGCLMPLLLLGGAAAFFMFGGLGNLLGSSTQTTETTQTQPQEPQTPESENQTPETPQPESPSPLEPAPDEDTGVVVPELAPPDSTTSGQAPENQTPETQTPETQTPASAEPPLILEPQAGSTLPPEPFTMSGKAQPNTTLKIEDQGQEVATATADAEGNWTAQLPAPTAGEHTYSVSGSDGTRSEFKVNVATPEPEVAKPTGEELLVFAPKANLRAEAKASAPVVTTLTEGTRVQVLQTQDNWYEVQTADGQRGWLSQTVALPSVSEEDLQSLVAAAQKGGELQLEAGVYLLKEPLTLTTPTRLIGAGRDQTRLVSSTGDSVLTSRGADLTLQGLTVQHTGTAAGRVLTAEGGKVTLRDVRLTGALQGDTEESGSGLWLAGGASADVQSSELVGNAYGAYLSDKATLQASQADFNGNSLSGIVFVGDAKGSVSASAFIGNGVNGVTVQGNARPTITDSTIRDSGERGIYVGGEATPTLTGNKVEQSGDAGIVFDTNASGEASENALSGNFVGIAVSESASPTISRNTVSDSRDAGLTYSGEAGGSATGNAISGSAKPGISLWDSPSPTLEDNTVRGGKQSGIVYAGAASGLLRGNTISDNAGSGVIVTGSASPDLIDNTLTQNAEAAILFKEKATGSVKGGTCEGNGKDAVNLQLTDPLSGPNLSAAGCTVNAQTKW